CARARGMERRLRVAGDPVQHLLLALHGRPGRRLAGVVRIERRPVEDGPRDLDRLHPLAPVLLRRQIVEAQRRLRPRVRAHDLHRAARVRVHRPDVHLVAVRSRWSGTVVADRERQEVEHQVGVGDLVVRAGEAASLEMVRRTGPVAEEQPPRPDVGPFPLLQCRLHRHRLCALVLDVHLQDHLEVYIQYGSSQPVSAQPSATELWRRPFIGAQWLFLRSGPGATNHFEGGGFVRSNEDVAYPNLMFHFLPLAIRYDGTPAPSRHGYQVHVGPMYSDARGSVKIISTDPHVHPALRFNYLSTDQDRREWVEALRVARTILGQAAFDPFDGGEISPGPAVETDAEILDWVARDAETALHPSCTCRMGTDELSVVDPSTLRVHGLEGLRVVDASVFPYVPNGNIYAPVMMVAEKAADLIRENTPLEPIRAEFYRHAERTASR
ncbi:MAG: hypothetical protein E6F98_02800, partial [Actinobacteria bacterium]